MHTTTVLLDARSSRLDIVFRGWWLRENPKCYQHLFPDDGEVLSLSLANICSLCVYYKGRTQSFWFTKTNTRTTTLENTALLIFCIVIVANEEREPDDQATDNGSLSIATCH